MLAGATADANLVVDDRDQERLWVVRVDRNHLDGIGRAMTGAVAASLSIPDREATLLDPHRMTHVNRRLVGHGDWLDGSCRTYFRALHTLWSAIAFLKGNHGLHQGHQVARWTQHLIGASGNAQLATGAMLIEVACADRSRWRDQGGSTGLLLGH